MCEKKGVGQGILWVMIQVYTDIYKTTRSGQEINMWKRENMKKVFTEWLPGV